MEPPSFDGGNSAYDEVFSLGFTPASMEPPSFDGGNSNPPRRNRILLWQASMEPPSFDGGNLQAGPDPLIHPRASMEPPSFDGGNYAIPKYSLPAAAMLQWSRRLSTAETGYRDCPTHSCQRSFNGAAVFRRRKQPTCGCRWPTCSTASMEPPHSQAAGRGHSR